MENARIKEVSLQFNSSIVSIPVNHVSISDIFRINQLGYVLISMLQRKGDKPVFNAEILKRLICDIKEDTMNFSDDNPNDLDFLKVTIENKTVIAVLYRSTKKLRNYSYALNNGKEIRTYSMTLQRVLDYEKALK